MGETTGKRAAKPVKNAVVTVHCSEAWHAWLGRLVEFTRAASVASLTDQAIAMYAKGVGFEERPPRR